MVQVVLKKYYLKKREIIRNSCVYRIVGQNTVFSPVSLWCWESTISSIIIQHQEIREADGRWDIPGTLRDVHKALEMVGWCSGGGGGEVWRISQAERHTFRSVWMKLKTGQNQSASKEYSRRKITTARHFPSGIPAAGRRSLWEATPRSHFNP